MPISCRVTRNGHTKHTLTFFCGKGYTKYFSKLLTATSNPQGVDKGPPLCPYYYSARYPLSRISRRIGVQIVSLCVDDNRAPHNILWKEPVCQHGAPRIPLIAKERRKISRMRGMCATALVKVSARVLKGSFRASRTLPRVVNVKSIYLGCAGIVLVIGQTRHLSAYHHPEGSSKKIHSSVYVRILRRSSEISVGKRASAR